MVFVKVYPPVNVAGQRTPEAEIAGVPYFWGLLTKTHWNSLKAENSSLISEGGYVRGGWLTIAIIDCVTC